MAYGENFNRFEGGGGYGGGGFAGGLASGLTNGLRSAMQFRMEQAQAARQQALAEKQLDPHSPMNQYLLAHAKAMDAQAFMDQFKNKTAEDVANIHKEAILGGNGGVGRGMSALLKGVLNGQEQSRVDTLPGALAIHNNLVDVWQATNKANGDAGVTTKLLQGMAANNPALSAYAQEIGGDPNKLTAVYHSMVRQAAAEQYKLVNGSNAAPSEEAISHNSASYPALTDSPDVAAAKFNTLNETQIRPSMMGPIGRLETFKDPTTGAYPVRMYQTVHDNLQKQLDSFGTKVKGLQGFKQGAGGDMSVPMMGGTAPGTVPNTAPISGSLPLSGASAGPAPAPAAGATPPAAAPSGVDPNRLSYLASLHANFQKSQQPPAAAPLASAQ